jgi:predicted aspartyl protease
MRHIWVDVKVGCKDASRIIETRALVDTDATLTVIPESMARELGLKVTGRSKVETGMGVIELNRSRAYVEIMGRSDIVPVLISNIIDKVLIGVTTLEILELEVDPLTGKLKERTLLLYTLNSQLIHLFQLLNRTYSITT